jgi:spore coat polysaccharide biosynthesis predicted glycosyltransferase SpsG/RimJ/RimL family protein N-acetyltransferase
VGHDLKRPSIALRCDGDETIGSGHVARCAPLADAFAARGWRPRFLGRYAGLADWMLRDRGLEAAAPDEEAPAGVSRSEGWDAVLVDSYHVPEDELCELARAVSLVTLAEARRCPSDGALLDYHLDRRDERLSARLLPGPAYAPLDPTVLRARRDRSDVDRVLVAVGGSAGAREFVEGVVQSVRDAFPGAQILVASGVEVAGTEQLPFPGSLTEAMAECDLAVSTAGLTAYELACAGIPAVVFGVADNQRRVIAGVEAAGIALAVDVSPDPLAEIRARLDRMRDAELRARLAAAGAALFDGAGAPRAAATLERIWSDPNRFDTDGLIARSAVWTDCEPVLRWRNDPVTRRFSFQTGELDEETHRAWFARRLQDPDSRLLIAEAAGVPVGQVRLDLAGERAVVNIAIAPEARGAGHGGAALGAAVDLARQLGLTRLDAEIKPENEASVRLFRRAGFEATSDEAGRILMQLRP